MCGRDVSASIFDDNGGMQRPGSAALKNIEGPTFETTDIADYFSRLGLAMRLRARLCARALRRPRIARPVQD
jgi:hypothetical protein